MASTSKTRWTIKVEAQQEAEDFDLYGLYEDHGQASTFCAVLDRKLAGTGYFATVEAVRPHRSAKAILEHLKLS